MNIREPRLSKEEHARKGLDLYEREIRGKVEAGNSGKVVAIDVDTGAFELGDGVLDAAQKLMAHHPDAQIWFVRIGHRGVHRFGLGRMAKTQ